MKSILFSVVLVTSFVANSQKHLNSLYFVQGKKTTEVQKENSTIKLKHAPFSIRFFNKQCDTIRGNYYSAKIIIYSREDDTTEMLIGKKIDAIHCFIEGTAIALDREGRYDNTIVNNQPYWHHNLSYGSRWDQVFPVSSVGDMLELEWKINGFDSYNDCKELFLTCLIDYNLNNVIDPGELHKVKMAF
jgi:hypothetical protein